jgi:outer membrane protein insertion porin family
LSYDYPITEFQYFSLGVSVQQAELITTNFGSAEQATQWVRNNGNQHRPSCIVYDADGSGDGICDFGGTDDLNIFGTEFRTYELNLGWSYDSRNRAIFADRGTRHRFNLGYTLPGSDVEFATASYDLLHFLPIWRGFTLMFNAELAYGKALGDTTALPPYRQYFAGGPDSVRGFRESRLGPQDSFERPYGGNMKAIMQTELLLPMPEKWRNSARFSLFFDVGNVFSDQDIVFRGPDGQPADYGFSYDELKQSAGVAVQWLAPLGVFRFSYAVPLNDKPRTATSYGDETEGFQFSIGQAF